MSARAVRIITEVGAVDRPFDYEVGDDVAHVGLGDRVRVNFHQRSVRGWVVGEVEPSGPLKVISKWLGFGPPASQLDVLRWASERWYAPWSRFLAGASPTRLVTTLPVAPTKVALSPAVMAGAWSLPPGVVQLGPTTDPLALIVAAYDATREREGSLVVVVPGEGWASRLRGRLEQRGCAVASGESQWDRMRAGWPVVVGARGVALAPVPRLAGAVIVDADDESLRSSAVPTWDAVTLLRERCRRDGAPLWCTSIVPSPELLDGGDYARGPDFGPSWPQVTVVDRRASDPREGVLSRVALESARVALDSDEPVAVVVVLQRLGEGRLLACTRCGELARCAQCAQAELEADDGLACFDRHETRARFCRHCGSTSLKRLRVGVSTLARDVSAQLAQPVSEVTAATPRADSPDIGSRVVVGTEAVWTRVRRCGVVVFVDFDQYLLAPRASARRAGIHAVGKAGRLVGSRREARGRVVLQTRRGEDPVVVALTAADFGGVIAEDVATARLLGLPPFGAVAEVTGEGADAFVASVSSGLVSVTRTPGGYVVRAPNVATLSATLREIERPTSKVRVAVR